jgi:hypothetical protein
MVGYVLGIVLARKVEGCLVFVCQERHFARPEWHVRRGFSAPTVVVAAGIAVTVVAPQQRHGGAERDRQ